MALIARYTVLKWHALMACFFLPLALLVFTSGALYTLGVKGSVAKHTFDLALDEPFRSDLVWLTTVATDALEQHGVAPPRGEPQLRLRKGTYLFSWADQATRIELTPAADPRVAALVIRERSPLTQIMRIHRGEAGRLLQGLSVAMAAALVLILASGVWLALALPRLRRPALTTIALGAAAVLTLFFAP